VPLTHLSQTDRRLIFEQGKPDRRLNEIATLAALRDRLRSADTSDARQSAGKIGCRRPKCSARNGGARETPCAIAADS
jgi:hypothetical protein